MIRASRSGANEDGDPRTDTVVRCSNTQRNIFNEPHCKLSFDPQACVSVPLPDSSDNYRSSSINPGGTSSDPVTKFMPEYAGPNGGGVGKKTKEPCLLYIFHNTYIYNTPTLIIFILSPV